MNQWKQSQNVLYILGNLDSLNPHSTISPLMATRSLAFSFFDRCTMFSHTPLALSHSWNQTINQKSPTCGLKTQFRWTFFALSSSTPTFSFDSRYFRKYRNIMNVSWYVEYVEFLPRSCSPKWHLPKSRGKGVESLGLYINDLRWALIAL